MTRFKPQVYLLSEKDLPPEAIAVAFAKASRTSTTFKENAQELTQEKSSKFHERWVIGYGHSSVAEHAVLHIAIENVSLLAIENLQSNRLCSFTEKSSRYQIFDAEHVYYPQKIMQSRYKDLYTETLKDIFSFYQYSIEPIKRIMTRWFPKKNGETEKQYQRRLHSQYIDNCRMVLPTACLAHLGWTVNARALEKALLKMLSHPLDEVKELGQQVKEVVLEEIPTLIKYARPSNYLMKTEKDLSKLTSKISFATTREVQPAVLIDYDSCAEEKLIAAILYHFSTVSYSSCQNIVKKMKPKEKQQIVDKALEGLRPHDIPLRELEHIYYTFDVLVDQGGYYDLKRHRIMTQTPQVLSTKLGFTIPQAICEAGLRKEYSALMEKIKAAYEKIVVDFPHEASYLVAKAFNRRFLMTLNLREVYHFCELRSRDTGHFSYRRIAMAVYEEIKKVHPFLVQFLACCDRPSSKKLEEEYFAKTC